MTAPIILLLAALLALGGCEAQSQPATTPLASEQKQKATPPQDQANQLVDHCARCHGRDGNQGRDGAPYIGGQHPQYLGFAMRAYINGLRRHSHMQAQLGHLTRAEIDQLADYFGRQPREWPGATETPANQQPVAIQMRQRGRALAESCTACHGNKGISARPEVPHLAGLDERYLKQAIGAYIDGDRQNELMRVYKGTLGRAEIEALAAYFSSLPAAAPANAARVRLTPDLSARVKRCAACHGRRASNVVPGIPHLAGQNKNYLRGAILAYRDGGRSNPQMRHATRNLSDAQIDTLAAYYASLKPFRIPFGQLDFSGRFAPLKDGATIAASCNGCHQQQRGEAPNLNGLSASYLQRALKSYQTGEREDEAMAGFVQHLNELDIEKVALYYATRPAPTIEKAVPLPGEAEELIQSCNGCHGEQGNSSHGTTPTLAGQKRDYLIRALKAYADKRRDHKKMADIATQLSNGEIDMLASYYAGQPRHEIEVKLPSAPKQIAARCDRCHGESGRSEDPNRPIIGGQNERYLIESLKRYKSGERENSAMFAMTDVLSNLEIHAIARHYARQAARD